MNGQFGKYILKHLIGKGSYGEVYLAQDTFLNKIVALKILQFNNTNKSLERFLQERDIISALSHKNIVNINDSSKINEKYFIDLEYIEGDSLANYVQKKGKMPLKTACEIIYQIADALHYAHDKNIIHRDIKPENILLDNNLVPYLTDFGIAKYRLIDKKLSQTGNIMGTPHFMAPEQLKEEGIDHQCDIYGLGGVLFYCLTGKKPFQSYEGYRLFAKKIKAPYLPFPSTYRSEIPPDLDKICTKATTNKKKERYQDMIELKKDIEKYKEGEKVNIFIKPQNLLNTIKTHKVPISVSTMLISAIMTFNFITHIKNNEIYASTNYLRQVIHKKEAVSLKLKKQNHSLELLNKLISIKNDLQNNHLHDYLNTPEKIEKFYKEIEPAITDKRILYATWAENYYRIAQRTILREKLEEYLGYAYQVVNKSLTIYPKNEALIYQSYLYYIALKKEKYEHLMHLPDTTKENRTLKLVAELLLNRSNSTKKEYEKQVESILLDAVNRQTKNFIIYEQLGFLYSKQGKIKKARKFFKKSIVIEPDNFLIYRQLAFDYLTEIKMNQLSKFEIINNYLYSCKNMKKGLAMFRQGTHMNFDLGESYIQLSLLIPDQKLYYLEEGYRNLHKHKVGTPSLVNRTRYYTTKLDIAIKIAKLTNKDENLYTTTKEISSEVQRYYREHAYDIGFLHETYKIKGYLEEKKMEYKQAVSTYTNAIKVFRYIKNHDLEQIFKNLLNNAYNKTKTK